MFTDVKYWGTFPSSNKNNKETAVSSLKETIRTVVKGLPRATPPNEAKNILIRHTDRERNIIPQQQLGDKISVNLILIR